MPDRCLCFSFCFFGRISFLIFSCLLNAMDRLFVKTRHSLRTLEILLLCRPKAILAISAHWDTNVPAVTAVSKNSTIHDFYGFPSELYQVCCTMWHWQAAAFLCKAYDEERMLLSAAGWCVFVPRTLRRFQLMMMRIIKESKLQLLNFSFQPKAKFDWNC